MEDHLKDHAGYVIVEGLARMAVLLSHANADVVGNPQLIAHLSKDAGAPLGQQVYADTLSKADQLGASYLQMMRYNIQALVAGMKHN
ncbi:MAG: hypothetical protein E6Q78_14440 [Rhodoferax sp.]|nr:MAG: hypothetical protein E6Q78_14440 [Rhodoferax sp.]